MAGLWETWSSNGAEFASATIITTDANDVVSELHDRMPVMLERNEEERWLEPGDDDELQALLDSFPGERTRSYEVSREVNNPTNEGPQLLKPVSGARSCLDEFSA